VLIALVVIFAVAGVILLVLWGRQDRPNDPIYNYSSVELQPVDPALFCYRQIEEIDPHMKQPAGIAIGAGDTLFVVGEDLRQIDAQTGKVSRQWALPQAGQCLAVDGSKRVYVGTKNYVRVFSLTHGMSEVWPAETGTPDFRSIAVSSDGRHIFVADRGNGWVIHYDSDGKVLGRIGRNPETGKPDRYDTKLVRCFDLAIGADQMLRVVDPAPHTVDLWTLDGKLDHRMSLPSPGCCNPTDIAMLPDGSFVAAEKGTKAPRVKVYDANGKLSAVVAGADAFMQDDALLDLAVDSQKQVYVLDPFRRTVRVFRDVRTASTTSASQTQPAEGSTSRKSQ
jgi:sugar lactone lactonase YvrE